MTCCDVADGKVSDLNYVRERGSDDMGLDSFSLPLQFNIFIYDSDGLCVTLHHYASFQCDPADISKDVALNVDLRARSAAQEINLEKSMSFKKICLFTSLEQKSSKEYIFLPPIHVIEIVGSSKPYQVPICGGHQFASHHVQCKLPRVSTVLRSPASFAFLIHFLNFFN